MEYIDNINNTFRHYFDVLEMTGSYGTKETYGLLLYSFIMDEVFYGPLAEYLDDAGLDAFNMALRCLYNNGCLINNPGIIKLSTPRTQPLSRVFRYTEEDVQRITEDSDTRRTE